MSTRAELQPAYVLHARPYRDSSLLLEVFTAQGGRLTLVARGARSRSRKGSAAALLQPFTPLLLSFSGKTELKTLTGSEAAGQRYALAGDLMYSALYMNELLVRLLHRHDPHPRLFAAYGEALERLSASPAVAEELRRFELVLLQELGYSFSLTHDSRNGCEVREESWYRYEPGHGLAAEATVDSAQGYLGRHLLAMAEGDFSGEVAPAAKRLLREAFAEHLGPEPLHSRELFQRRDRTGGQRPASGERAEDKAGAEK